MSDNERNERNERDAQSVYRRFQRTMDDAVEEARKLAADATEDDRDDVVALHVIAAIAKLHGELEAEKLEAAKKAQPKETAPVAAMPLCFCGAPWVPGRAMCTRGHRR